jgi:hypothetical protein
VFLAVVKRRGLITARIFIVYIFLVVLVFVALPFLSDLSKNEKYTASPFFNKKNRKFTARIIKTSAYSKAFTLCSHIIKKKAEEVGFKPEDKKTLIVYAHCILNDRRSDSHNLIDATMDIIQDALNVNDRYFQIGSWTCRFTQPKGKKKKDQKSIFKKGTLFLKLEMQNSESDLNLMMTTNFINQLESHEKTKFLQMTQEEKSDGSGIQTSKTITG